MSSHSQLSKKRKTHTDYGDTEPTGALHALQAIRDKLKVHGAVDPDNCQAEDAGATINVDDTELAQFDGVIEWMKSKTLTAESYSFSSADPQLQAKLRITEGSHLNLKKDLRSQLDVAKAAGENNFMSSKNMYRFLEMLVNLVATPASARTRIDAFLYRAAAMLPANKQMVLNVEFKLTPVPVPTVSGLETVLVGFLDYTIIVTDPQTAVHFLGRPDISSFVGDVHSLLGCFVVEAKDQSVTLGDCTSQVVTQLYAVAKKLKKTHIRGALTNGYTWFFVILTVNIDDKGVGASYRMSQEFTVYPFQENGINQINQGSSDLICGMLATWIEHGFNDVGDDDWFVKD